jgi:hypothetical protein
MAALYTTIWISLLLFTAGEVARSRGERPPGWAWWAFTAGLALSLVHTFLAFAVVHGWSHDHAVRATAAQTEAVFGMAVGAGVYVNYVFFAVWAADAAWWRLVSAARPAPAAWTLRAFYLIIILNAAVIFAAGWRRALGAVLVCALLTAWRHGGNGGSFCFCWLRRAGEIRNARATRGQKTKGSPLSPFLRGETHLWIREAQRDCVCRRDPFTPAASTAACRAAAGSGAATGRVRARRSLR